MRFNLSRDTIGAAAAVGAGLAVLAAGIALASESGTTEQPDLDPIRITVTSTTLPDATAPATSIDVAATDSDDVATPVDATAPTTTAPIVPEPAELADAPPASPAPIPQVVATPQVVAPPPTAALAPTLAPASDDTNDDDADDDDADDDAPGADDPDDGSDSDD